MKAHFLPNMPYSQAMANKNDLVRFGMHLNYQVIAECDNINLNALNATGIARPNEVSVLKIKDISGLEYLVFQHKGQLYFSINHTLNNWCVYFKDNKPSFVNRYKPQLLEEIDL